MTCYEWIAPEQVVLTCASLISTRRYISPCRWAQYTWGVRACIANIHIKNMLHSDLTMNDMRSKSRNMQPEDVSKDSVICPEYSSNAHARARTHRERNTLRPLFHIPEVFCLFSLSSNPWNKPSWDEYNFKHWFKESQHLKIREKRAPFIN